MIDLKDDQLQDIIQSVLNKDEGLNELLELILNGLMKIERTQWMASNSGPDNLVIADGLPGLDQVVHKAFPRACHQ